MMVFKREERVEGSGLSLSPLKVCTSSLVILSTGNALTTVSGQDRSSKTDIQTIRMSVSREVA